MSGSQRLQVASDLFVFARGLVIQSIRAAHPDWTEGQVRIEALRRIQGDAIAAAAAGSGGA